MCGECRYIICRDTLFEVFDIEYEVENKIQYYDDGIKGDIRLSNTATKITIYNLNSSDKLIYIDGDTFVFKNVDELFEYPVGSATIITTKHNVKMAMSSLFSFVPCRGTYQLLQTCVKYAGGMLDGGMIGAIFNDNIQNENMIFPQRFIIRYSLLINHLH